MSFDFSKELAVNHRPFAFHFRKVPASYLAYQVEVTDETGVTITFSLIRPAVGSWRVTGNRLPLWIGQVEAALGAAIEEQRALIY